MDYSYFVKHLLSNPYYRYKDISDVDNLTFSYEVKNSFLVCDLVNFLNQYCNGILYDLSYTSYHSGSNRKIFINFKLPHLFSLFDFIFNKSSKSRRYLPIISSYFTMRYSQQFSRDYFSMYRSFCIL